MHKSKLFLHLLIAGLFIYCSQAKAQSCADVHVKLDTSVESTRTKMTIDIAKQLKMSLIAEYVASSDQKLSYPPPEARTLQDVALLWGNGLNTECVIENNVIHIFELAALQSKNNALNYMFEDFAVPAYADLFVIKLRLDLLADAFRTSDMEPRSGSDAGAMPNDSGRFKLIPERITHIEARRLLLREAAIVPMIFIVEVNNENFKSSQSAWEDSNKKLKFAIIR